MKDYMEHEIKIISFSENDVYVVADASDIPVPGIDTNNTTNSSDQ